jgi:hypothetical protein
MYRTPDGAYQHRLADFPEKLQPYVRDMIKHDAEIARACENQAERYRSAQRNQNAEQSSIVQKPSAPLNPPTIHGVSVEDQYEFLRRQSQLGR